MRSLATSADDRLAEWISRETGLTEVRVGATLTGGNANVTRLIESAEGRFVLRQPPSNAVSDKSASGISREYIALKALQGRARSPQPVAWCDDTSITGQSFSIISWCEGVALTDTLPDSYDTDVATVDRLGRDMLRAIGEVHEIDPTGLVPERFGRPDGFIRRQIERWSQIRRDQSVRDLPSLALVADWLLRNVPPAGRPSLIHCDFHLDNCLVRPDRPEVVAILDWEMATLGDARIDLGMALFFWGRDTARTLGFPRIQAVSNRPGIVSRDDLAAEWSLASGMAADDLDYFMAFAAWRLAAIVEGAYCLFRAGKVDSAYAKGLEQDVPNLLAEAEAIISGRGTP